jgi:catechol 1,2-dioxygenase
MHHEYKQFIDHLQPTQPDIEGPFYKAGAPLREHNNLAGFESPNLWVSGRVLSTDGSPIPGALLDIWQANEKGEYDHRGFLFRGKVQCDGEGNYSFSTVRPGDYQIADSPPDFRCAHIHVKLTADGYAPLTTQLYFADDQYNATDHWFDERRVIKISPSQAGHGKFDFVLARAP